MHDSIPTAPPADEIAAALVYLRHFPEPFADGAFLCRATGETVFIAAETLRAAMPAEAAP